MSSKTYLSREYLNWQEAAELLGTDSEGLRQALQSRLSPTAPDDSEPWLPVVVTTRREGFLTRLVFDNPERVPTVQWNGAEKFHSRLEGRRTLDFSDGTQLALHGKAGKDYWDANHGYGSGFGSTFTAGGGTLVLSPHSVRHACAFEGDLDSVDVAPRDWCTSGFPTEYFHVVEIPGSMFDKKPINIFEAGRFLVEDVTKLLEKNVTKAGKAQTTPKANSGSLDSRAETAYLNTIGALLHLMLGKTPAGKPQSVYASQTKIIEAILAHHGEKYGISQRNLEKAFAAAKKSLES